MAYGTAIVNGNSIYNFGGRNSDSQFPIQRLDMATDGTIKGSEHIGAHYGHYYRPILFITDANTCVTN